jgi:uroporphyrin-III C-methyltransferase / precorrin-2 dehydrogenase / sirohydrochlorin ferrochelatase
MSRTDPALRHVPYFAAFLDLLHKKVVVVGGGRVAASKVRALLSCQPSPLIVTAPRASASIQRAAAEGKLLWLEREYASGDLSDAALAFGASDDRDLNARVAADARALGIPVLAVDDVPNCDLIAPALVRRGDLTVAISTAGRSPAMARRTREYLERTLPPFWADLLDVAATAREQLGGTRSLIDPDRWQSALDGEVEQLVASGDLAKATELLTRKLERSLFEAEPDAPTPRATQRPPFGAESEPEPTPRATDLSHFEVEPEPATPGRLQPTRFEADAETASRRAMQGAALESEHGSAAPHGLVSLVGAGPGDPDLLTLRAVQRLQAADVIVHDRLVSPGVLDYAAPAAARIDVGKRPGGHGPTQSDINALLVELARRHRRVVRLKGGDPFVFGRGGEEALALARAGLDFEIVPGVSSALAAPAAAGIPVTHRGLSASLTVLNGHDADQHDWSALARGSGTLVFLMAVENLETIANRLLTQGRPSTEPTALIEWATTPRQRVITAPLAELVESARDSRIAAPAVLVVGPTAALAAELGLSRDSVSVPEMALVHG